MNIGFGKKLLKRIELSLPEAAAVGDPFGGVRHGARVQATMMHPPAFGTRQQTGVFQHAQMPRDRRSRDMERLGQLADSRLGVRQPFDDAAADRIRKSRERGVNRGGLIFNHQVKYRLRPARCQECGGEIILAAEAQDVA